MHRWTAAIAALVLSLVEPLARARADMRLIPPITGSDEGDLAVVLGGLALALAAVLSGLWLVRRRAGCMLLAGLAFVLAGVALGFPFRAGLLSAFLFVCGLLIGLRGVRLRSRQRGGPADVSVEKTRPDV